MFKFFMLAVAVGIFGSVMGLLIASVAVSTWTSISTDWLNAAVLLPVAGLVVGNAWVRDEVGESAGKLRALLTLASIPLCGASNFMAFVLASRTWFADKIPAEHQSLIFQITHPDVLPELISFDASNHSNSTESWMMYLVVGACVGPVIFWFTSRRW